MRTLRDCFRSFFHTWIITFLQHRIGDRRILRLIKKRLRAGVLKDGEWSETEKGTPQGSAISPLGARSHYAGYNQEYSIADDFRRNSGEFLQRLRESKRPIALTINGKAAVVQDADTYQRLLDTAACADIDEAIRQGLRI